MLNLIIKDIIIQKKTFLYSFLYTVSASVIFSSMKPFGIGLYLISPIITTYFFISYATNYDDKNKSEIILNSLPLKKRILFFRNIYQSLYLQVLGLFILC